MIEKWKEIIAQHLGIIFGDLTWKSFWAVWVVNMQMNGSLLTHETGLRWSTASGDTQYTGNGCMKMDFWSLLWRIGTIQLLSLDSTGSNFHKKTFPYVYLETIYVVCFLRICLWFSDCICLKLWSGWSGVSGGKGGLAFCYWSGIGMVLFSLLDSFSFCYHVMHNFVQPHSICDSS